MPQPAKTLGNWIKAVAPGGILAICYWPKVVEPEHGPWTRLMTLNFDSRTGSTTTKGHVKQTQSYSSSDWESSLLSEIYKEGGMVCEDRLIQHTMVWENVDEFWEIMTRAGPWHARRVQIGEKGMETMKAKYMKFFESLDTSLEHAPKARLLVITKLERSHL